MPLTRIDLNHSAPPERGGIIGTVVYEAMTTIAGVPLDDLFQVVTRHGAGEIIYPRSGYLGVKYTDDLAIIQITWNAGRTVDLKKAFFRFVADEVARRAGISASDVWINLVEVPKENWSFGDGEMQYG